LQLHIKLLNRKYHKKSDESLISLIHAGNVSAFNELFNRYGNRLYWYFYKMLNRDEEKSKDFLQDLFLKIIEKAHYFDSGKKFSSWIYTIATNMCLNEYKMRKIRTEKADLVSSYVGIEMDYPTIDQEIDRERFKNHLLRELDGINSATKSIFLLRFQENMSIKEISKMVSLPEGTVKSRLFYTVKKLAQRLQPFHQTG
jgi:RNA polymerase sigma-70 factor (ECF subfamily)